MKRNALVCLLFLLMTTSGMAIIVIPMDAQIDLGMGPAITAWSPTTLSFEADAGGGFTRAHLAAGNYYDGPFVDLQRAGQGPINIAGGGVIDFEVRYFQDPNTNTSPYTDAPIFLTLQSIDDIGNVDGWRDFGIVYATQPQWNNQSYPDWTNITIDLMNSPFTDSAGFNPSRVNLVYFWGTDWAGTGDDFADFRNLDIAVVPEPATLTLFGIGLSLAGLAKLRRSKK